MIAAGTLLPQIARPASSNNAATVAADHTTSTIPATRERRYAARFTGFTRISCSVPDENSGPIGPQPVINASNAINVGHTDPGLSNADAPRATIARRAPNARYAPLVTCRR